MKYIDIQWDKMLERMSCKKIGNFALRGLHPNRGCPHCSQEHFRSCTGYNKHARCSAWDS
jgi:hypothetical protein